MGEQLRQFKFDLTSKWALAADKDNVDDTVCEKYDISKEKWTQFCQSRRDPSWEDSIEEQASQGSFVTHGRVLTVAIGRPEHPGRVCIARAGITIKQYFGPAPRTSRTSSSMALEDLEQLTQNIRDQLEETITKKVTQQLMLSFSQMESQFQSQMQSHGLILPPEPEVGPSATRVSTKKSCVDPSGNDPDTGDSEKDELYVEENPPHLVALARLYKGSTIVHNIPLHNDQVKVGVEEVREIDALILVPTQEGVVGPAKPADRSDRDVDDPLYLMTLTIPQLFLKSLQVTWDATVFGVFNDNFPLYINHEDISEIAHGGQCLNISIIKLWILHMTETSMQAWNVDVYGFLEPQSIQRSGQSQFESKSYIKIWMQNSKRDVYLGAYLNGLANRHHFA
ncbi:hypothetical protein GmHk_12G035217 [Glycine max]|nr:hypothetical protein GmHk_12G035217 [Glycine max]KAH1221901.1 hypothetical protein GmHk_12G035217 [Glycine max]KAH1221902.1 hypothetical protein GmHk_12G035217 [Glycine max]